MAGIPGACLAALFFFLLLAGMSSSVVLIIIAHEFSATEKAIKSPAIHVPHLQNKQSSIAGLRRYAHR